MADHTVTFTHDQLISLQVLIIDALYHYRGFVTAAENDDIREYWQEVLAYTTEIYDTLQESSRTGDKQAR